MVRFLPNSFDSLSSYLENRKVGRCKVPLYVVMLCLFAATGGLMFGYDNGVSGGVTVMDSFLCKFFDAVLKKKIESKGLKDIRIKECKYIHKEDWDKAADEYTKKHGDRDLLYCLFGNKNVQLFTSSLYLAAMVGTCFAAYVSRQRGRKMTIILAGLFYDVGVVLNIASGSISNSHHHVSFSMLILGRMMLGLGVGFGNQAIPLFISEIAPANARGALNHLFQLNVTIGILLASIVNLKAMQIDPWGWRLSLGLAGIPALTLTLGSFFLIETPNSLVQRGLTGQAHQVLNKIRGQDLDATIALEGMVIASYNGNSSYTNLDRTLTPHQLSMNSSSDSSKIPKKHFNGLFSRSNRPPLIIAIFVQLFQQFTGINVVVFYAPVIFNAFGSKTEASLQSTLVIAIVNVVFTIISIFLVDRYGRRRLLLVASLVMLLTQLSIGMILISTGRKEKLDTWHAILLLVFVSTFVGAFACSWGPLGWLISTEIFPLACRSEGQSITVFFNMLFTFIIAHVSLSMLCTMKFTIFFFFASWAAIMGALTYFFLPETMNMEIEIVGDIWYYHWYWRSFVTQSQAPNPPHHPPSSSLSLTSQLPFPSASHMDISNNNIISH